jgi:hypothetical protein
MKKSISLISIVFILGAALTACSAKESAESILALSGIVEFSWAKADLKSIEMIAVDYVNKDGETTTYEGIALKPLLDSAGVKEFEKITLVAFDGYTAEITYEEVAGCSDCIIAFQEEGGLRTVMSGFSSKLQVRDLVEIQIN